MGVSNNDKPVVVLTRGLNGLGVVRGLGQHGISSIVVTDSKKDLVCYSKYPREVVVFNQSSDEAILGALKQFFDKNCFLLGTSDDFLDFMNRNRGLLEEHFRILLPSTGLLNSLLDKVVETEIMESAGVPIPKTIQSLPSSWQKIPDELRFPIIIKPRIAKYMSILKKKNEIIPDPAALELFYSQFYESLDCFLAQEIIPGDDSQLWVINCVFGSSNELLQSFIFQRLGTSPSHYGVTSYAVSQFNQEIQQLISKIGKYLKYTGPAMIEFKFDQRDKEYKYIEINPRIGMCNYFDTKCGVNNVVASYFLGIGEEFKFTHPTQRNNIYFLNFFADCISRLKNRETISSIIRLYFSHARRPHIHAHWTWKDPKPGLINIYRNLPRLFYHFFKRLV